MVNNYGSSNNRDFNPNLYTPEALEKKFLNDGKKAALDGFDPSKMVPAEEKKERKPKKKGEEGDTKQSERGNTETGNTEGSAPGPGETGSDFPFSYGGTS